MEKVLSPGPIKLLGTCTAALSRRVPRAIAPRCTVRAGTCTMSTRPPSVWDVLWMFNGWLKIPAALEQRLSRRGLARVRIADFQRPLDEQIAGAHCIMPSLQPIDARMLSAAPNLKLVMQPAVGYNNIDVLEAQRLGISVCNTPSGNTTATAEYTIALLLSLCRHVVAASARFDKGGAGSITEWHAGVPDGMLLEGKVAVLLGRGTIGSRVERVCTALGMRVHAVTSTTTRAQLESLLGAAHVLLVLCPLNEQVSCMHAWEGLRRPR